MLTKETKQAILDLQKEYPEKRSAIIPALHLAQKEVGFLPTEIQQEVADLFGVCLDEVNSLVTFYEMFYDKPVGKHLVHVCQNLPCMLRGADALMDGICQKLCIKSGETTKNQQFTIFHAECLGACDRAPAMMIDQETHGPVPLTDIDKVLDGYK